MRIILRGKSYDSETARLVGVTTTEDGATEELHRKRTGEYFLYVVGRDGRQNVKPLDYDKAKQWGKEHLTEDGYKSEFGRLTVEKDENGNIKYTTMCIRVPVSSKNRLERYVAKTHESRGTIIARFLDTLK